MFYTENLIFSAPTSAGKSVVADLLLIRPLSKNMRREDSDVQVDESVKPFSVYIVPFLSLISEKERKFIGFFRELGLTYSSIHSHKRAIISETSPPDIVFCTI